MTTNLPERDEVCLCPKRQIPVLNKDGYFSHYATVQPRNHKGNCPFFEDNSHAESETLVALDAEYVF